MCIRDRDKVILNNLNLTFCGSQIDINSEIYSPALTVDHCRNVELNRLVITNSRGVGMVILSYQGGRVNMSSTSFKFNKLPQEYFKSTKPILGGGGVYIQLDHFLPTPHLL